MVSIRSSVFETNSSSCHSIIIMNSEDYKDLQTSDKLVVDTYREISEHETIETLIDHDKILSIESALEQFLPKIEEKIDSDEYDTPYIRLIRDNWNEELIRAVYFGGPDENLTQKANDSPYNLAYFSTYDIRDVLQRCFGIYIESYRTLFSSEEEVTVGDTNNFWTPHGDCVVIIDTDVNC